MKALKKLFDEYCEANKNFNEVDRIWEEANYKPRFVTRNEEYKRKWLEASDKDSEAHDALIIGIVEFSNGRIDERTARRIVATQFEELKKLFAQVA